MGPGRKYSRGCHGDVANEWVSNVGKRWDILPQADRTQVNPGEIDQRGRE